MLFLTTVRHVVAGDRKQTQCQHNASAHCVLDTILIASEFPMRVHCVRLPVAEGLVYTLDHAESGSVISRRESAYPVQPGRMYWVYAIVFMSGVPPKFLVKSDLAVMGIPSTHFSVVPASCFQEPFPSLPSGWRFETYSDQPPFIAALVPESLTNLPSVLGRLGADDQTAGDLFERLEDC